MRSFNPMIGKQLIAKSKQRRRQFTGDGRRQHHANRLRPI